MKETVSFIMIKTVDKICLITNNRMDENSIRNYQNLSAEKAERRMDRITFWVFGSLRKLLGWMKKYF